MGRELGQQTCHDRVLHDADFQRLAETWSNLSASEKGKFTKIVRANMP